MMVSGELDLEYSNISTGKEQCGVTVLSVKSAIFGHSKKCNNLLINIYKKIGRVVNVNSERFFQD
jgi:hypothetical protein